MDLSINCNNMDDGDWTTALDKVSQNIQKPTIHILLS